MIIRAPSRIHMSLIDLNGSYRRVDGGIGLALADPQFVLEVEQIESGIELEFADTVTDEEAILECQEKIPDAAQKTIEHFDIDSGFRFIVHNTYPPHSGFGSGTQIAVSTAHLITETMGIEVESRELSAVVGRGGTSGIGTYTHDLGGFILDGGHSKEEKPLFLPSGASQAKPATLIARYDFPEEWNILIAIPYIEKHMEGDDEVDVFQTYCPIPKEEVEQVSHLILMNLPTMKAIEEAGAYGVGISSFGPVLYTMFDESNADIVEKTKEIIGDKGTVFVTKAQNHGFVIEK